METYEISKAIKESRYFLALLSHNSLTKTGYVRKELKTALEIYDQFSPEDIFILPARLEECKPSDERLEYIHWADLFPDL
ncbi:MAG: TIR domain-containing protein [Desulfobacteraceae bacterium]|nr:TIR domain-containing protein [Desulfobacteraceae bacterium]